MGHGRMALYVKAHFKTGDGGQLSEPRHRQVAMHNTAFAAHICGVVRVRCSLSVV